MKTTTILATLLLCTLAFTTILTRAADPLPSWNDGKARQSIIDFVTKVTTPGAADFGQLAGPKISNQGQAETQ